MPDIQNRSCSTWLGVRNKCSSASQQNKCVTKHEWFHTGQKRASLFIEHCMMLQDRTWRHLGSVPLLESFNTPLRLNHYRKLFQKHANSASSMLHLFKTRYSLHFGAFTDWLFALEIKKHLLKVTGSRNTSVSLQIWSDLGKTQLKEQHSNANPNCISEAY